MKSDRKKNDKKAANGNRSSSQPQKDPEEEPLLSHKKAKGDAMLSPGYTKKFAKKIIVDMDNGPVKSLEEAIAKADEGTIIKLTEGVYTCNVSITKPGIKIEPREKN